MMQSQPGRTEGVYDYLHVDLTATHVLDFAWQNLSLLFFQITLSATNVTSYK